MLKISMAPEKACSKLSAHNRNHIPGTPLTARSYAKLEHNYGLHKFRVESTESTLSPVSTLPHLKHNCSLGVRFGLPFSPSHQAFILLYGKLLLLFKCDMLKFWHQKHCVTKMLRGFTGHFITDFVRKE